MPEDKLISIRADVMAVLEKISFSLERSASAAEATHELYKKANEATKRAMDSREERERESNERAREDFKMAKERHEAFMKNEKAKSDREGEWMKKVKELKGGSDGNTIPIITK